MGQRNQRLIGAMLFVLTLTILALGQEMSGAVTKTSSTATDGVSENATASGRISGIIKDPSGAVVPGAAVQITGLDSGSTQSTVTDRQGRYMFDGVSAGRYQLSTKSAGFQTVIRSGIAVTSGKETVVDMALKIEAASTVAEVTAPAMTVDSDAIAPALARTSDTASLLNGVPGLSFYTNGGVSSLPVIHGLADDRVKVLVNGMSLEAACSNHMNPALSYIDPGNVGSINVLAGITPVSNGGDSLSGTIVVDSPLPEFAGAGKGILTWASEFSGRSQIRKWSWRSVRIGPAPSGRSCCRSGCDCGR